MLRQLNKTVERTFKLIRVEGCIWVTFFDFEDLIAEEFYCICLINVIKQIFLTLLKSGFYRVYNLEIIFPICGNNVFHFNMIRNIYKFTYFSMLFHLPHNSPIIWTQMFDQEASEWCQTFVDWIVRQR